MNDPVNHPTHYTSHPSGVEVLELTRRMPFGPGNAVKYVLRRDFKGDPVENLRKAEFYILDSINNGIGYRFSSDLMARARSLTEREKNPNVASFISALCINGIDRGWFIGREPDYDLALDLIGVLLEQYPMTEVPC